MSQLDESIQQAIYLHDDIDTIVSYFRKIYATTVYPPIEELETLLLVAAVEHKHFKLVEKLLSDGFPVNYKFGYASPLPLHAAVLVGDVDAIQVLLKYNASVNLVGRATVHQADLICSAVEFALLSDRPDIVELLHYGYSVDDNKNGYTLLHLACLHGSVACLHHLLSFDEYKANVNMCDKTQRHYTPLMLAIRHGLTMVRLLLDHGASVQHTTADYHCTILHLVASKETYAERRFFGFVPLDFPDVVHELIVAGCSINAVDICGETPLSLLCAHIQNEVMIYGCDSDSVQVPYDVTVHRHIILEASKVLLDAGASACGRGSPILPLGVLTHQIQLLLGLQSDRQLSSVEQALITSHQLFILILSHCQDTLNGWRPELVAINIIDMLRHFCCKTITNYETDLMERIIIIVTDIFRHLLLLGAASSLDTIMRSVCQCLIVSHQRFIHLFEMLLNVVDENGHRFIKNHVLENLSSATTETSRIPLFVLNNLKVTRSLQQLCRVTILYSITPIDRIRRISSLNLPQRLINYLLLFDR